MRSREPRFGRAGKTVASRPARALWLLAAGIALHAPAARAQTLFDPPDTTVDVGKYATLEECLAATERVRERMTRRARQGTWNDTLPWNPREQLALLPEPLVSTARRCSARLQAATVPLSDFGLILPLYLVANRDADVSTLVSRRLAAVHGTAKTGATGIASGTTSAEVERLAVLDSVFNAFMEAKPARISAADSLATAFDKSISRPMRAAPAAKLMAMYLALALRAQTLDDTLTMRARGARTIALLDSLSPAERAMVRETEFKEANAYEVFAYTANIAKAGFGVMLDSLRKSTAAFVALQRSIWVNATGERPEAAGFPIGRQAPQLVGTQIAARAGASGPRPVPGKVNLLVFMDAMCTDVVPLPMRLNAQSFCLPEAAAIRRIAARFPALEITIVDRTRGYFMYSPPTTPEEEAVLIAKGLEAHHVPGTPVIGTTEFFRLAAPDRRRIAKKELPNFTPYTFGKSWPSELGAAFLIDQNGTIVYPTGQVSREFETFLGGMIECLLAQRPLSVGAGSPHQ